MEKLVKLYGVFTWNADNRYHPSTAVKVFKSEKTAQKFCDRDYDNGNAGNYVVRWFYK